jgi:hypothetical protein
MRRPRCGLTFLAVAVHTRHSNIDRLPSALDDGDELTARLGGKRLIAAIVDALLAEHPKELKVTPGKMVYEIQPR